MPENWLFIAFMSLIVVELVLYRKAPQQVSNWLYPLTFGVFVITFFAILNQWSYQANGFLFREMLFLDGKAIFFKGLIVIAAMVMLLHAWLLKYRFAGEYFPLLIGMLLGLFLLTMAVNLLMLFLSIEIVSVASYLLTAFQKDRKSAEGAIKYALFGTISAAVMLYGMSLLYGLTGTLNFVEPEFTRAIAQADSVAVIIAILFTVSGFLFKISANLCIIR